MQQFLEFVTNHPLLWTAFFGILGLLVFGEIRARTRAWKEIGPLEATALINHEDAVVLDVREAGEYRNGHILNAVHVPLGELPSRIEKLKKYQGRPIIAYCQTGTRSGSACSRLEKAGFERIYNLRGGAAAWVRENLPVTPK